MSKSDTFLFSRIRIFMDLYSIVRSMINKKKKKKLAPGFGGA